ACSSWRRARAVSPCWCLQPAAARWWSPRRSPSSPRSPNTSSRARAACAYSPRSMWPSARHTAALMRAAGGGHSTSSSTVPRVSPMDRERSARRIERDIETLAGSDYTLSDEAIRRYAYAPVYRNTLDYFARELEAIGFEVEEDPVGTLFARNRPKGEPVFGLGSHCDS